MGFFSFFGGPDINTKVEEAAGDSNGILLDVRSRDEFAMGHIKNAVNIPLDAIEKAARLYGDKHLYVYCASGSRSGNACMMLKSMGVTQVENIGGIVSWRGEIVR